MRVLGKQRHLGYPFLRPTTFSAGDSRFSRSNHNEWHYSHLQRKTFSPSCLLFSMSMRYNPCEDLAFSERTSQKELLCFPAAGQEKPSFLSFHTGNPQDGGNNPSHYGRNRVEDEMEGIRCPKLSSASPQLPWLALPPFSTVPFSS